MKQRNIPWVGAFIESLYNTLPLLSIINFISILAILYASTKDYLLTWVPWITLWMFICAAGFLVAILMVLVYKFILPSIWTFRGKQLYGFESDLMEEVRKLRKEIEDLRKEVKNE